LIQDHKKMINWK